MNDIPLPHIGDWFKNESGGNFEVVALDEDEGTIEIQYFDGAVEEIDIDSWYEEPHIAIEPPEDWSGSMDVEREDYGVDLETNTHLEHQNPLDELDQ
jgi:hypothetical protein